MHPALTMKYVEAARHRTSGRFCDDLVGQTAVIDKVGQSRRKRARTNIERQLDGAGPVGVNALGQHGDRAQRKRFRVAQLRNRHQDEQEVHRKRAGNAGQSDAQPRSQNRDAQITDELCDVLAALVNRSLKQRRHSRSDHQANESLGADGQASPRVCAGGHSSAGHCAPLCRRRAGVSPD